MRQRRDGTKNRIEFKRTGKPDLDAGERHVFLGTQKIQPLIATIAPLFLDRAEKIFTMETFIHTMLP